MFTTTLTRVTVQPIIHPLPFGPGDVVHWPAAGDIYHCYHKVDSVFMQRGSDYVDVPFATMFGAHHKSIGDAGGSTWTNPVENFLDVRVVASDRPNWRQGAPYLFVEREEQTESIDVEHRYTVGDVLKATENGIYEWLVTGVVLEHDRPVYQLTCQDGSGYETTSNVADEDTWKLVGGPRFVEKVSALQVLTQARDLIATPDQWIQGVESNGQGAYCAVGAIHQATSDSDARKAAYKVLGTVVKPDTRYPDDAIVGFNDANDRTHEQVLAAFDAAIANARFVELNG